MDSNRFGSLLIIVLFLADLLAGVLALTGAYYLRFHVLPVEEGWDPQDYLGIMPMALVLWMVARFWAGLHRSRQRPFGIRTFRRVIKANLLAVLLIMSAAFYTQIQYSRFLPPLLFGCGIITMSLLRLMIDRQVLWLMRTRAWGTERVALVGISQVGRLTAQKLMAQRVRERIAVGFIAAKPTEAPPEPEALANLPLLGSLAELDQILATHRITEVFVTDPCMSPQEVLEFLLACEKRFVRARVVPNVLESMLTESHTDELAGIPLLGLRESRLRPGNMVLKRVFDIVVSAMMILLLSPLLILIALLVKLTSRGPVFYWQERISLDGETFPMCKFRTMRTDAEQSTGPVMTTRGDPRVTPIGRFLRASNLDELPQLFNVLRGDMSLVGPRPERPFFVDQFKDRIPRYMARHRVKAGITGWAQVNGLRGETSIDLRLEYDLFYLRNWSIWFDIKILAMTLKAWDNAY